ncbi:T9SS type A sorting domain-containing protein [uncultured Fluviicola sp.]|uniref:T9SS type A sorting domain-containing protein n=1 Tax=uncultured Fluviicola sp. TaxID=463303 RepID=UPI0025CD3400|nr:T9SS type A sorting domain-containing protein [uncultured Fluviicola sp.]
MKIRINRFLFLLCGGFLNFFLSAQELPEKLRLYENHKLINENDTTCTDIKGEWEGEEIVYDQTRSFVRSKFSISFDLKQEGNKVHGTSFFKSLHKGSYGVMKMRGIIIGDKLHFEEYEVLDEKIYEKKTVWCYMSGEMQVKTMQDGSIELIGLSLNNYDVQYYQECTEGFSEFSFHKSGIRSLKTPSENIPEQNAPTDSLDTNTYAFNPEISIYPNPMIQSAAVTYFLPKESEVRVDIYNLSGAHIQTIIETQQNKGRNEIKFDASKLASGVYVLVIQSGNNIHSKQFIKQEY